MVGLGCCSAPWEGGGEVWVEGSEGSANTSFCTTLTAAAAAFPTDWYGVLKWSSKLKSHKVT